MTTPTIIDQSPIQRVIWVAHIVREKKDFTYDECSMPGHHVQVVSHGRIRMETAGRIYEIGPGGAIWLHDNELVHGRVLESPWKFYAIHFHAPSLSPPDYETRMRHLPPKRILGLAQTLLRTWCDRSVPPLARMFNVQSDLLRLLALGITPSQHSTHVGHDSALWWEVENELRKDLSRPIEVATMAALVKRSPATITRSCRSAVGLSPLQRVKQLRMSITRCLVWTSKLSFSEIAYRIGYARLHEFSRDYHKLFGVTPTQDRERFPRIYKREFGLPFTRESDGI